MPEPPDHHNARHLVMLGNYSIQRGDFATAAQAFRKVIEQEPEFAGAHHNLGVAYYKEGHFDQAKAALRRAGSGFLKTVGIWHPSEDPVPNPYGGAAAPPLSTWRMVRTQLSQNYAVQSVDLSSGRVPGDIGAGDF